MTLKQLLKLTTAELRGTITLDDAYIYWRDVQNYIKNAVEECQTDKYSVKETEIEGTDYSSDEKYIKFTTSTSDKEIHKVDLVKTNGTDETRPLSSFVFNGIEDVLSYPDLAFLCETDGTELTLYTNETVNNEEWKVNIYYAKEFADGDTVDSLVQELYRHYVKGKFDETGMELQLYRNATMKFINKITTRPFRLR